MVKIMFLFVKEQHANKHTKHSGGGCMYMT